jgi:hypothetical protein
VRHLAGLASAIALSAAIAVSCATEPSPESVAQEMASTESASVSTAAPLVSDYQPYINRTAFRTAYRRITESQYRNTIADIFGPDIKINARFEPERREDGLQAIGNARLSITTSGLEQYFAVARSIADQVVDGDEGAAAEACATDAARAAACAEAFIKGHGRQLFRRPLTEGEIAERMSVWGEGAADAVSYKRGLKLALISLLVAPEFLFRVESAEADPSRSGEYRLDAYSKAVRLSHLLWDASPDAELLAAADSGAIHTQAGFSAQVDRMLASPRLEQGVRALFTDMLHFEAFDTLTKDAATYPKFSQAVADSAREETLRFMVEHLVKRNGDYRDIFTTRDSVINRTLAAVYNVPYPSKEAWSNFTFPEQAERSGILTQVTFLSLFSHPAASSPTLRGVKLHEIFLCVPTPDPPADVDFSKVQALANGTVRTRLIDHMTNPGCSSCHALSDPAGLTLEHYDGLGQIRKFENGTPIDVSAEIGGKTFTGASGLGEYLHDSPLVPACLVRNVHHYGAGRPPHHSEQAYLQRQTEAFAAGGYKIADLYRNILMDAEFLEVTVPAGVTPRAAQIANNTQSGGGAQ